MSIKKDDTREVGTREAIRRVINEMLQEGKLPNGTEIFDRLGRGSKTTIYQELDAWQREAAARLLMPEAPEGLWDAFQAIWADANRLATTQFEAQRQELETQLSAQAQAAEGAQIDLQNALDDNADLRLTQDRLRLEADQRERQLAESLVHERTRNGGLQDQLNTLAIETERLHGAISLDRERHTSELQRAAERYDGLERRMVHAVDEARQELKRTQKTLAETNVALTGRIKELAEATTRAVLLEQQVRRVEQQLGDEHMAREALQKRLIESELRAEVQRAKLTSIAAEQVAANDKRALDAITIQAAEDKNAALLKKLDEMATHFARTREEND